MTALAIAENQVVLAKANPGPQTALVSCPADEVFYGGARGGGKTYGILLDWAIYSDRNGGDARGIIFRKTYSELDEVLQTAREILLPLGAVYRAGIRTFFMPNGSEIKLRHLQRDSDADKYQGHQYSWMAFDELPNWASPYAIDKLKACLRSAKGVQSRLIASGNPGGAGHNWVKARYIDPAPPFKIHILANTENTRAVFIPSKLSDNQPLMKNDPNYVDRLKASGPEWLVKAWLNGDWDIVAGGMFDDIWHPAVHTVRPFVIPHSWYVDRSYDSGFSHPFSVGWWAEADGTEVTLPSGDKWAPPPGTLFRIAEWYGWNGTPNEGINLLPKQVAEGIVVREKALLMGILREFQKVNPGPADTEIWRADRGKSIADTMEDVGVEWTPADKSPGSRVNGWQRFRAVLNESNQDFPEDPCLYAFDTCRDFIRTVPGLPRDDKNPDDVDTTAEDHIADEARYRIMDRRAEIHVAKLQGI